VLVPQLVDVAIVSSGQLADSLAYAMSGARVGVTRAGSALTSGTVIAREALALTRVAVTAAFVGALHVVVSRVHYLLEIRVAALGKLLRSSVWVVEGVLGHRQVGSSNISGHIQISLRGVDVRKAVLANTLRAVIRLPIAVANAHIIAGALAVAIATIGALRSRHGDQTSHHSSRDNLFHHS
jgi:hypothetical protein